MDELATRLFSSHWETLAVSLSIIYLLLAIAQHISCWVAAFFSTLIYTILYWGSGLFMESLLNIFYLLMAVYGWLSWKGLLTTKSTTQELAVTRWTPQHHFIAISSILIATFVCGYFLTPYSDIPYVDSFTTFGAVVATFMVSRKILENWIYWLVINSFGIYLNIYKDFHLIALLLCCYQIMSVVGFIKWRKSYTLSHAYPI